MRICLFVDSQEMGGIESHMLQVISGLLEDTACFVDILFWKDYKTDRGSQHPMLNTLSKMEHSNKARCRFLTANASLITLYKYMKKVQPIVHTHGYKAGVLARLISLSTNTPVVSTYHNGDPGKGKVRLYNMLDRATSFLSTNIAVNDLISLSLKNCTVISNFVKPLDHSTLAIRSHNRRNIAFVGRLSHEKGPDIFAEITEEINMPITVYGDGPMANTLKSKYLHIDFKGMCEMDSHWQDIRILVMPSRFEGLPLAALEAMARGIPVIASQAGSLPELIKTSGVGKSISVKEINFYKKALNYYINQDDHQYEIQAKKSIEFINNNFSKKSAIPKIVNQYKRAADAISVR